MISPKYFLCTVLLIFQFTYILLLCSGEPIFFKNEGIFSISGDIQPINSIFYRNESVISVNDQGDSLTLICNASCPVEWKLEKFRFKTFSEDLRNSIHFKTKRIVLDFYNLSTYSYVAEMKIESKSNKVTGNYVCSCIGSSSSSNNTSVYVYWAGSSPSYLLQDGEDQTVLRSRNSSIVGIYCGVSRPDQNVYLYKITEVFFHDKNFRNTIIRSTPSLMTLNESVRQDADGFALTIEDLPRPYGNYICSTKNGLLARDIEVGNIGLSTPQTKASVQNKFPRGVREKRITSYREMKLQSENSVFYDMDENTLICCDEVGFGGNHAQVGFYCENPQQCNFFKYRLSGHNANAQNETCTSYKIGKKAFTGAATFRCTFTKIGVVTDLDVYGEQFFSLKSDTFFGVQEAIPSRMVQLQIVKGNSSTTIFFGESINLKCQIASYPFSQGIVWILKMSNGSQIVVDKGIEKSVYKVESKDSDNEIKISIFDKNITKVECHVPLWNSGEWWSSEIELDLADSSVPTIVGENDVTLKINDGDTLATAECKAFGIPKPQVKWLKDGKEFQPDIQVIESGSDLVVQKMHIPLVNIKKDEFDSYECVAFSKIGEATKKFHLRLNRNEPNTKMTIGISLGVLVLFVFILIFLLRKIFVQRRALRHLTKAEIEEFEKGKPEALANWTGDTNGCSHLLPYNTSYEIPRVVLQIDEGKILGQGTYGIVMKGILNRCTRSEREVAVKTIKPNEDVMHFKILLCELKIMAFIGSHPHIVSLVGACSRDIRNRELLVAIEYCANGNLHDYLRKCRENFNNLFVRYDRKTNKITGAPLSSADYQNIPNSTILNTNSRNSTKLDSRQLLVWACQIASGMEFLSSKKVIHGDLAARNILLTEINTAKIGDFGLSKQIFEYATYTKKTIVLLPWKWMAIESLQDMTFSVMSDVWSYGVTLWEMFTLAQIPYPGTSWDDDFIDKLLGDYRLPQPQFASKEIYELMLTCWASRAEYRPTFVDIKEAFMNFIAQLETSNSPQTTC